MDLEEENKELEPGQKTPEEYLAERKTSIRTRSWWAIGIGGFVVFVHLGWLTLFKIIGLETDLSILLRSVFFILGFFAFVGGILGLRYAKSLTINDLIPTKEAIEYLSKAREITPYYTYILVGCIVAVTIAQLNNGLQASIDAAGLVKSQVWKGEYWRLLTCGALHGGILHIYFNGQALYGLGGLVEYVANRAHLAIVFVLSIITGALASFYFMPDTDSIGASGGIMGVIGYLAVFGNRRKQQLPPDFLKSMLINIGFIAAFGLVAYQIVDNFAHFGGLLTGAIYGFFQISKNLQKDPRQPSAVSDFFGMIAMGLFVFASIFSILLILGEIKL